MGYLEFSFLRYDTHLGSNITYWALPLGTPQLLLGTQVS